MRTTLAAQKNRFRLPSRSTPVRKKRGQQTGAPKEATYPQGKGGKEQNVDGVPPQPPTNKHHPNSTLQKLTGVRAPTKWGKRPEPRY